MKRNWKTLLKYSPGFCLKSSAAARWLYTITTKAGFLGKPSMTLMLLYSTCYIHTNIPRGPSFGEFMFCAGHRQKLIERLHLKTFFNSGIHVYTIVYLNINSFQNKAKQVFLRLCLASMVVISLLNVRNVCKIKQCEKVCVTLREKQQDCLQPVAEVVLLLQ